MILAQLSSSSSAGRFEWTEIISSSCRFFLPLLPHFHIDPLFFGLLVALKPADRVLVTAGGDGGVLP